MNDQVKTVETIEWQPTPVQQWQAGGDGEGGGGDGGDEGYKFKSQSTAVIADDDDLTGDDLIDEDEIDEELGDDDETDDDADDDAEDEDELDDDDDDELDEEEDEEDVEDEDDDTEEVELTLKSGKKITVPKEVADGMLMQKDYTQKTQALAENRKLQIQREQEFNELSQKQMQNFQQYTRLATIDEQLADYEKVDWVGLAEKNPDMARQHQQVREQLRAERQAVAKELEAGEKAALEKQNAYQRANLDQIFVGLKSTIDKYSPEVGKKVAQYAIQTLNVPEEAVKAINNGQMPAHIAVPFIQAAYDSMVLKQMRDKAKAKGKKKGGKAKVIELTPGKSKKKAARKQRPNIYDKNLSPEKRIELMRKRKERKLRKAGKL